MADSYPPETPLPELREILEGIDQYSGNSTNGPAVGTTMTPDDDACRRRRPTPDDDDDRRLGLTTTPNGDDDRRLKTTTDA